MPVRTFGRHPNLFVFDPRPLWRLLGDGPWDLIDLHEEPFGLAVAEVLVLRRLRARRTPFLVCSAQNIDKRYPPPFRWFERWSLRRAAGAYTCNTEAGAILRRKGLGGELELLPLGCRRRPVPTRSDRPPPAGRLRVGFVGRLIPHKGVDVLLRAAGPGRSARRRRLRRRPRGGRRSRPWPPTRAWPDRVTFHGHVDESVLPEVYPTFDVLAVPSVPVPGWLEQFGRVVVEAQAAGVPSVASASGALPDVVGDIGSAGPARVTRSRWLRHWPGCSTSPGLWERLRSPASTRSTATRGQSVARLQQRPSTSGPRARTDPVVGSGQSRLGATDR